jgi:hypothetical protein
VRSKPRWIPIAPALLTAALACAPQRPQYDPFKTPREKFVPALRVIALAPMKAPKDLENADEVTARFMATIEARLRDAGIATIPPAVVGPIFDAAIEWRGGFFDPNTGEFDEAKLRGAREEALGNLVSKMGRVDAILFPDIRVVRATLVEDTAVWNGARESASSSGWKAVLGVSHSGWLRALSLVVRVTGARGEDLYVHAGGIRVLDKIDVRGNRVPVPQNELFADERRNAEAISLALDALVAAAREAAAGTPQPAAAPESPPSPPPARDPAPATPQAPPAPPAAST